jgi:AcrR family transcriptional regulator
VAADDEELWAPFLAFRTEDRRAARLRRHVEEDMKRGGRHVPRRAAALSRDEIVRAAINVADAEGADAISMRRIAREVSAGTMSLYWHVASKEELLDLMIDAVMGEQRAPEPSGYWRADLGTLARNARSTFHQHLWVMDFMVGRPPAGPKALQNLERALGTLDGIGLDKATAMNIVLKVTTYALGAVLREVQEANGDRYLEQFAGVTDQADGDDTRRRPDPAPRTLSAYDGAHRVRHRPGRRDTRDARFEFGLDCLLTGCGPPRPPPDRGARNRRHGLRLLRRPADSGTRQGLSLGTF